MPTVPHPTAVQTFTGRPRRQFVLVSFVSLAGLLAGCGSTDGTKDGSLLGGTIDGVVNQVDGLDRSGGPSALTDAGTQTGGATEPATPGDRTTGGPSIGTRPQVIAGEVSQAESQPVFRTSPAALELGNRRRTRIELDRPLPDDVARLEVVFLGARFDQDEQILGGITDPLSVAMLRPWLGGVGVNGRLHVTMGRATASGTDQVDVEIEAADPEPAGVTGSMHIAWGILAIRTDGSATVMARDSIVVRRDG